MKRIIKLSLFLLVIIGSVAAQDAHFSQWSMAPLHVNPALCGIYDGTFRLSNLYRTQWSGIKSKYETIGISADAAIFRKKGKDNFFGLGLLAYQEKAGAAGYKMFVLMPTLSYTTPLDANGEHFLSLGVQAGLNQRSLDLTGATWGNQWNGDKFDPALSSGEALNLLSLSYFDANAGFMYYYVPDGYRSAYLGASVAHLNKPDLSFFVTGKDILPRRLTVHTGAELPITRDYSTWFVPRAQFMLHNKQREIDFGFSIKNKLQFKSRFTNFKKEVFFYLGGHYRYGDAIVPMARIEYNSFGLGISYDFTISELSSLAGGANALEIGLSWVNPVKRGQRARNYTKTPRFF
ncbi:MAG: hypothetical protein RIQ89_193 [Bacteroidota bacterium]|jgi:type IX secretion system PorP/SprF family membrane protein